MRPLPLGHCAHASWWGAVNCARNRAYDEACRMRVSLLREFPAETTVLGTRPRYALWTVRPT